MIPAVTVPDRPKGWPTASTQSPVSSASESPQAAPNQARSARSPRTAPGRSWGRARPGGRPAPGRRSGRTTTSDVGPLDEVVIGQDQAPRRRRSPRPTRPPRGGVEGRVRIGAGSRTIAITAGQVGHRLGRPIGRTVTTAGRTSLEAFRKLEPRAPRPPPGPEPSGRGVRNEQQRKGQEDPRVGVRGEIGHGKDSFPVARYLEAVRPRIYREPPHRFQGARSPERAGATRSADRQGPARRGFGDILGPGSSAPWAWAACDDARGRPARRGDERQDYLDGDPGELDDQGARAWRGRTYGPAAASSFSGDPSWSDH